MVLNSLLTVLSKDLQEEFYSYFPRVLACIVRLLKHREVDVVEVSCASDCVNTTAI